MGNMESMCTAQRDKDVSMYMDRLLDLQKELTLKDVLLQETTKKLTDANKQLEEQNIFNWKQPPHKINNIKNDLTRSYKL